MAIKLHNLESISKRQFRSDTSRHESVQYHQKTPLASRNVHHILAGIDLVDSGDFRDGFMETLWLQYRSEQGEGNFPMEQAGGVFRDYLQLSLKRLEERLRQIQYDRDVLAIVAKDEADATYDFVRVLQDHISQYIRKMGDRSMMSPKQMDPLSSSGLVLPRSVLEEAKS